MYIKFCDFYYFFIRIYNNFSTLAVYNNFKARN
jgi:hypothetical protein